MPRVNLFTNPAAGANTTGWSGTGITRQTALTGFPRATGVRVTSGDLDWDLQLSASRTVTISVYASSSVAGTLSLRMDYTNATGGYVSSGPIVNQTVTANQVVRMSTTVTIPANATGVGPYLRPPSGGSITATSCLIEEVSTTGDYFDGESANASWNGARYNSASTLNDVVVVPETGANEITNPAAISTGAAWSAGFTSGGGNQGNDTGQTEFSRTTSYGCMPTATSDSWVNAPAVTAAQGEAWSLTIEGIRYSAGSLAVQVCEVNSSGAILRTVSAPAATVASGQLHRNTVNITVQNASTTGLVVRLFGTAIPGGTILRATAARADKRTVSSLPYADGATADWQWAGAANASRSFTTVAQTPAVNGAGSTSSTSTGSGTGRARKFSSGSTSSLSSFIGLSFPRKRGSGSTSSTSTGSGAQTTRKFAIGSVRSTSDGSGTTPRKQRSSGSTASTSSGQGSGTARKSAQIAVQSLSTGSGVSGSRRAFTGRTDSLSSTKASGYQSHYGSSVSQSAGSGAAKGGHRAAGSATTRSSVVGSGSGKHVGSGSTASSSRQNEGHRTVRRVAGTPIRSTSATSGAGIAQQIGTAGIVRPNVGMSIRLIQPDGKPGEFLPDWVSLAFTDKYNGTGTVGIEYAKEGRRATSLTRGRTEGAMFDGEKELPATRFLVTQTDTDGIKEDAAGHVVTVNAPQYVPTRLAEATIYPYYWPGEPPKAPPATPATPDKTVVSPPRNKPLADAAQEVLNAINSGKQVFEDFTYRGCSQNLRNWNDALVDDYRRGTDKLAYLRTVVSTNMATTTTTIPGSPSTETGDTGVNLKLQFGAKTPGFIIGTLIGQAKSRGAIPEIVQKFSATSTSNNQTWANVVTMEIEPGGSILATVEKLAEMGVLDWTCQGRELVLLNPDSGMDRTQGNAPIILQAGRDVLDAPEKMDVGELYTSMLVTGKDGIAVEVNDAELIQRVGYRIEGFASVSGVEDKGTLQVIGKKMIDKRKLGTESFTHELTLFSDLGPQPWSDYFTGDWILRDMAKGQVPKKYRVAQLSVTYSREGAVTGNVVLGTRFDTVSQKLQAQIDALTNGNNASSSAPADSQNTDDTVAPMAPTGLIVTSSAYNGGPNGAYVAAIAADWLDVTRNVDGSFIRDLDHYEVQYNVAGGKWGDASGQPRDSALTFSPVPSGVSVDVRVRAVDNSGNASAWSEIVNITTASDDVPPPVPTAATITPYLGQLVISWDGRGV